MYITILANREISQNAAKNYFNFDNIVAKRIITYPNLMVYDAVKSENGFYWRVFGNYDVH